jgi:hypothetical protein
VDSLTLTMKAGPTAASGKPASLLFATNKMCPFAQKVRGSHVAANKLDTLLFTHSVPFAWRPQIMHSDRHGSRWRQLKSPTSSNKSHFTAAVENLHGL